MLVWLVESAVLTSPLVKWPVAKDISRVAASPCLPEAFTTGVRDLYDRSFRAAVHDRW